MSRCACPFFLFLSAVSRDLMPVGGICYDACMADAKPVLRFVESLPGRLTGWLLAALWIYSMAGLDSRAYSAYPACLVLVAVLVLGGIGVLAGYRLVRMSWLGWFTLAAGGYFLVRCLNSYAVVDSWAEEAIILGAMVYYVAGVYAAQLRSYKPLLFVLAAALVLNISAFWATKQPWFCLEWTGRAQFTPEGRNTLPMSLLIYKNFAGFFFAVGGLAMAMGAVRLLQGMGRWLALLLSGVCIVLSFFCLTRVPYFVLPLGVITWVALDLLHRMQTGKRIGWVGCCVGFALLSGVGIAAYDLLFGNSIGEAVSGIDSHLRYHIWAAVCDVLPGAPLWGYGAGATEWEIIPYYSGWHLPNYAHNDYLQVWADHGIIGFVLVVVLFTAHVIYGVRCQISEATGERRRWLGGAAVLILVVIVGYALADFPWHEFSLVTMGAFACGVLASPFSYVRSGWAASLGGAGVVKLRAQKWLGKVVLLLGGGMIAWCGVILAGKTYPAWKAQWQYNELSQPGADPDGSARRGLIAELLPQYPSSSLMDTYYRLPVGKSDIQEQERLLTLALEANSKQLFIGVMLAEILDRQQRFEESERLFRRIYEGKSIRWNLLASWHSHYAYHLLSWGRHELRQGSLGKARSLLEHGLKIDRKYGIDFFLAYRVGDDPWLVEHRKKHRRPADIQNAYTDERLLRKLGVSPEHDWKQPLRPGEFPALYSAAVEKVSL